MVKESKGRGRKGSSDILWLTRELEYRSGLPVADIARRHVVSEQTVRSWVARRKWTVQLDPSRQVAKRLSVEIARAERALVDGDIGDAEKRVRAASALARATRTLSQLEREVEGSKNIGVSRGERRTPMNEPEERRDDFKAELHRRLLRIVESSESKKSSEGVAGSDQRGSGGSPS